jgi:hypothetical protein
MTGYSDCMDNNDFNNVLKASKLNEKKYKFFENLVKSDSPTQGDILSSYHAAGYKKNDTSKYYAYHIYNSASFQRVLQAYRRQELEKSKNREFTILERTTEDLNFIIDKSRRGGDLSTMRQAVMDRAKLHGLLVDRHQVIDSTTDNAINAAMRLEAARLAEHQMLAEGADDVIEGEVIPQDIVSENSDVIELPDDDDINLYGT